MYVIGYLYRDYICSSYKLGHHNKISCDKYGGVANILEEHSIASLIDTIQIACSSSDFISISNRYSRLKAIFLHFQAPTPFAFILDSLDDNHRTSFASDVECVDILPDSSLAKHGRTLVVYYGDFITIPDVSAFNRVLIDCVDWRHLSITDLKRYSSSTNLIISCSLEDIDDIDSLPALLQLPGVLYVLHSPQLILLSKDSTIIRITNAFYKKDLCGNVVGLGDKFTLLLASELESDCDQDYATAVRSVQRKLGLLLN